ncbi:MAG: GHKL domain-containing protein, partial [Phycisphaerales bacterium]|nr:GHKL domain-containing protein [Phycisphaerales bacterium]
RDEVDAQRGYLAAVLGRLSSGVLTIDVDGHVRTANPSAALILGLGTEPLAGRALGDVAAHHTELAPLVEALEPHLAGSESDWQAEVIVFGIGGRQVLMCRGTTLPGTGTGAGHSGHVIVFDDITALVQAQRNAAWGEAARRLAHEIKNPLTPIQLSAERLRHKYLHTMNAADADVLDRLTHTIVQQVETMKGMVNTFSEYARAPRMEQQPVDVNTLIEEVVDLFRSMKGVGAIDLDLEPGMLRVHADPNRLRQVLNNLIKNALEATPPVRAAHIRIATRCGQEANARYVEICVEDEGEGVPQALTASIFDPYVTTKTRGTGLGLAIVRKIIEEHGGVVWLENKSDTGARIIIRLPSSTRVALAEHVRNLQKDAV